MVVLPEISKGLPTYPLHLNFLEYLFVLVGFVFIHISEKLILQKVEVKAQKKVRKLMRSEKNLEIVEDNIANLISRELMYEELDVYALKDLARVITSLNDQSHTIKFQIDN